MNAENNVCNCVQATDLLNKIVALLECEITKDDIPRILEMLYNYISLAQYGFYVSDLANIMRLMETSCDRFTTVPTFKDVLMHILNICKIPPFLKVSSDLLRYVTDIREYFAVLGYLLILVDDLEIQRIVIDTIISLLENKSKYKNQLPLRVRRREAANGRLPGLIGQALFLITDKMFNPLLDLTFKFIIDCPDACKDIAINDALNSLFSRMEGTWRSRFPSTHPNLDESPIMDHLNLILAIVNVITAYLGTHKDIIKDVPNITRFSLWNIKHIFHHVTIVTKWTSARNNLITSIMCIMDFFRTMEFISSGLGEVLLVDGNVAAQTAYDLMWKMQNDDSEGFYFIKAFLLCLPLYMNFPNGKAIVEKCRIMNTILRLIIIHTKAIPPIEHACVIKILVFKVFNKIVPHLEEDFIENSGPVILLNVVKNISMSKTGLTVAVNSLDTLRRILKSDTKLCVSNSILFNNGFNILIDVCKEIIENPEFGEEAQICIEEIFIIVSTLFENINDPVVLDLPDLINIPLLLLKRFLHPRPEEPLYDNRIIINAVCFIWDIVTKHMKACELFFKGNGVYILLDIMQAFPISVQMVILGTLVDLCEFTEGKCIPFFITWKGKFGLTFIPLLMQIFREENELLGVQTGPNGEIADGDHPLMGKEQYEEVFVKKNFKCNPTVADMHASCRPKIYALLTLINERYRTIYDLANENYKTCNEKLSAIDQMTLVVAENYLGLKFGEAWEEIKCEFEELNFQPISTDELIITSLVERTHKWGHVLQNVQREIMKNDRLQNYAEEYELYNKLRDGHIAAALESINEAKYIARCTERMFRIAEKFNQINQVEKSMSKTVHGSSVHKTFMSAIPVTRVFKQNISIKTDYKDEDFLDNMDEIPESEVIKDEYKSKCGINLDSSKIDVDLKDTSTVIIPAPVNSPATTDKH